MVYSTVRDHLETVLPGAICLSPALPCTPLAAVACVAEPCCSSLHLSQHLAHWQSAESKWQMGLTTSRARHLQAAEMQSELHLACMLPSTITSCESGGIGDALLRGDHEQGRGYGKRRSSDIASNSNTQQVASSTPDTSSKGHPTLQATLYIIISNEQAAIGKSYLHRTHHEQQR